MGTKYNTTGQPTRLINAFGDTAEIYPDGRVVMLSGDGTTTTTRKFGSRPTAIRNFLGGSGGWRVVEDKSVVEYA